MSSFAGLEMGKRALNAFRLGIQTAGHNVSNVMTEGYSRQKVSLATTNPYAVPGITTPSPGQIGTGVMVSEIIRIRDEFLDFQFRSELSKLGYWSTINQYYNTVETYFAEPAGTGIRATFDAFWSSLQDLQSNPESPAARQSVVDQANSLGTMLNTLVSGVDEYASIVNTEVKSYVDQVNTMLHEVASLNTQISAVQASGQNPNDLMDQRDLLLDKLSEMMDVDIQDPFKTGDVMGEFFLTLNGRTLVQGDKVREVVAHAFQWENQTYYDVQVRDNEFDIVEDCGVALAISTGPEGVHMLSVDRLANGEAWTVGGEDALCLNPNGSVKMDVEPAQSHTSEVFENGVVLGEGSPGEKYNIRLSVGGSSVTVTLTWNDTDQKWDMSNDLDTSVTGSSAGGELLGTELESYLNSVFSNASNPIGLTAAVTPAGTGSTLTIASADGTSPVTAVDDGNILGLPGTPVSMRVRPITTTEALGLSTSFRIQVGSQGTLVASKIFSNAGNPDLDPGDILGEGQAGESYTFRVAADDYEANITVKWNDATQKWDMTSDTGHSSSSAGTNLAAGELSGFLSSTLPSGGDHGFIVRTGGTPPSQFSIASADNHLISITDVEGDLAAHMGMVNTNPVVTIDVAAEDSLETIRNKINEKYQEAYGLT
ncbi:MAG: flagellar hook-associated protein FlgK, partial [Synergistaceae bacterium]|nr:flagellar hook-associated protein FlgK [Synergistaceae bacterium]